MDIVKQLQGAHWTDASERLRLVNLAADEIERLREEVEHLHKMTVKWSVLQVEGSQEIQRLRQLVDTLDEEVVNLCQQRLELRETLYEIANGPRDVDKSYISLLHEIQSEARQALGEKE